MDFFNAMDPLLRTFWYVAIPASVIFIIQSILTFSGFDFAEDVELEEVHTDDGFQLFSFRNLINFLLGLSWTGISCYSSVENKTLLMLIAIAAGALMVYIFFIIIRQIQRLAENNAFQIRDAVNQHAEVYLRIPAHKSGKGKVLVSIKGAIHELEAITEAEEIPSGTIVKVSGVVNQNVLLVVHL